MLGGQGAQKSRNGGPCLAVTYSQARETTLTRVRHETIAPCTPETFPGGTDSLLCTTGNVALWHQILTAVVQVVGFGISLPS